MIKTLGEFVDHVEKMREAQRWYFRSRLSHDLNDSKKLEKQVDQFLEYYRKQQEEDAQPGLGL